MKKIFKRFLSSFLVATLVLSTSINSFALSDTNINSTDKSISIEDPYVSVDENNKQRCVVKEINNEGITIAINNKETNILTLEKYDKTGKSLLSKDTIDLNTITDRKVRVKRGFHWGNGDVYQHTFTNREYDFWYGSPREWKIRKKDSVRWVKQTNKNKDDLNSFRNAVEDVNDAEFVVLAEIGGTAAAAAIAAFTTGGLAAGIAAAGGGSAIAIGFSSLNKACRHADYYFGEI